MTVTLTVDLRVACAECGNMGATPNALCLPCNAASMEPDRVMKSREGKLVQQRWARIKREIE